MAAKHGPTLTPAAYADMPYTMAVVKETLRLAQIIFYVPRIATRQLNVPGGPTLPAGCPSFVALAAVSASDPALQKSGDGEQFKPERCALGAAWQGACLHQIQCTCVHQMQLRQSCNLVQLATLLV